MRYIVAVEVAGAWGISGGFGAPHCEFGSLSCRIWLAALPLETSIIQNMETASRVERAQSSARSHLAQERGNPQLVKDELAKINNDRLRQCVRDQMTVSNDRKETCDIRENRHQSGRCWGAERSPVRGTATSRMELRNADAATAADRRRARLRQRARSTRTRLNRKKINRRMGNRNLLKVPPFSELLSCAICLMTPVRYPRNPAFSVQLDCLEAGRGNRFG